MNKTEKFIYRRSILQEIQEIIQVEEKNGCKLRITEENEEFFISITCSQYTMFTIDILVNSNKWRLLKNTKNKHIHTPTDVHTKR